MLRQAQQELFADAIEFLRLQYPNLAVRGLDGIIWRFFRAEFERILW